MLELWSSKGYPPPSLGCLEFPPSHSSYHPILPMIKNSLLVHHSTARPLDPERGTSCIQSSDSVLGPAHTSIRENEQENVSQISWTIPSAFSWPAQVMLIARATIYVLTSETMSTPGPSPCQLGTTSPRRSIEKRNGSLRNRWPIERQCR